MSDEESWSRVRVRELSDTAPRGDWMEGLRRSVYDRIGTRRIPYREYAALEEHIRWRHEYESFEYIRPNGNWVSSDRRYMESFSPTIHHVPYEPITFRYPEDTMTPISESDYAAVMDSIIKMQSFNRYAGQSVVISNPAKWVCDLIGAESYFPLTSTCSYPKSKFRPKHPPVTLRPEFYVRDISLVNMDEAFDTLEELLKQ